MLERARNVHSQVSMRISTPLIKSALILCKDGLEFYLYKFFASFGKLRSQIQGCERTLRFFHRY